MIYLDTAALVKLIRVTLVSWLNARQNEPLIASALVDAELPRALRRSEPGVLGGVAAVIARLRGVDIDQAVRATAGACPDPPLGSLDAIRLATAELLVAAGFVTYDRRLAEAARQAKLPVTAPR